MCTFNKKIKIENIIIKSIKKVNKSIQNNKNYYGRYEIRVCYHTIATKENTIEIKYCFEIVDKQTNKKNFFNWSSATEPTKDTIIKLLTKRTAELEHRSPAHQTDAYGRRINYKKIKID